MPAVRASLYSTFVLVAAAALAACAQSGAPTVPPGSVTSQAVFSPDASATPPPCTGQKNTKKYSYVTDHLSTKGGSFCVPSFGGWGGSISYPTVKPAIKMKVTSSTSDYNKLPQLGSGTAMFYMQFVMSGPVKFGNKIKVTNGLTAAALKSGKSYTMFGEATVEGSTVKIGPCYALAKKGTYGGVLDTIGALFEYGDLPYKGTAFIEVYSGKQTKTKC